MEISTQDKMRGWVKGAILAAFVGAMYYTTLSWLVIKDWNRDDYTYGWMIPVIVLYLLWDNRYNFSQEPASPSWWGGMLLLFAMSLYWVGELSGEFFTQYFSLTLIVIGLCWMMMGWRKLKTILFALVFSLAMYPPPNFLHNKITFQLKLISSELGVWLLHLYGMSAYREGNIIDLGFTQLQVVDACSGLRYLFPLLVMTLLLAYFFKSAFWKKCVLVFSAIPLTIVTNSFRIAMTGVLYEIWGPVAAEGFFHSFSGWFIFMFGLVILLIEMRVLNGFRSLRSPGVLSPSSTYEEEYKDEAEDNSTIPQSLLGPPQFFVAVMLLATSLFAAQFINFSQKVPMAESLSNFPLQLGHWYGKKGFLEQKTIDTLDLSDYVIVNYTGPENKHINFYAAYYESQTKGESIHSPATCLPGSGWLFDKAGTVNISISYDKRSFMPVNRAFMSKGAVQQLSYYWFPQRGRILTNAYQLKIFNLWDALTKQRTDGGLVRLITPVYPDEELEDADARMVSFMTELVPEMARYFPN